MNSGFKLVAWAGRSGGRGRNCGAGPWKVEYFGDGRAVSGGREKGREFEGFQTKLVFPLSPKASKGLCR
jgi:hypothetical protein